MKMTAAVVVVALLTVPLQAQRQLGPTAPLTRAELAQFDGEWPLVLKACRVTDREASLAALECPQSDLCGARNGECYINVDTATGEVLSIRASRRARFSKTFWAVAGLLGAAAAVCASSGSCRP